MQAPPNSAVIWEGARRIALLAAVADKEEQPTARNAAERLRRTVAALERSAERLAVLEWLGHPYEQIARAELSAIRRRFWASQRVSRRALPSDPQ